MKKYSVIPEKHRRAEVPDMREEVLEIIAEVSELIQEHWEENGFSPTPSNIALCYAANRDAIEEFLSDKVKEIDISEEELADELEMAASIMRSHALMMAALSKTL